MGKNANFVSHKKSKQIVDGKPKLPLASDLVEGEIAINFGKDVETLSIRNESGDVVTFSSDNYYTEKKLGSGFTGENSANTVTSVVGSGFTSSSITDVIIENEEIVSAALTDLDERKLDASAYTPSVELWESGTGENAIAQKGGGNTASGKLSVAEGSGTTASGNYSYAEGRDTKASGDYSHAEGYNTVASGDYSHAEGNYTSAMTYYSHAEGSSTKANGNYSHAEGNSTIASGDTSHAEGTITQANGISSHAEGSNTKANGYYSHAEGRSTSAMTDYSHAEGSSTKANGSSSHAEGNSTTASGNQSHAEGGLTLASGDYSHAEGSQTSATTYEAHAEGWKSIASGSISHAEGNNTTASGSESHAEGKNTTASGSSSHAEGLSTTASGNQSHAEGYNTVASGSLSHAEGDSTKASGNSSHAEGNSTIASGSYSHAEGYDTKASGAMSHAEGQSTTASGENSHAEGQNTSAMTYYSHAEGYNTLAIGYESHAEGRYTEAKNPSEHASGRFNVSSSGSSLWGDSGNTLFSVGNGTADDARHNAFEIRQNGDIYIVSGNSDIKLQDYIGGGGSITVDQVLDDTTSASTNPVSSKAVYDAVTDNELVWTNAFVALSGAVSSHTSNTNIHVTAANKTAWDGKIGYAEYDSTNKLIIFYDEENGSSACTIDATDFIKDGMVNNVEIKDVASGEPAVNVTCLVITFNSDSGKQDINIPISDIFNASNYYTKTEVDARDLWVSGTGQNAVAQKGISGVASGDYAVVEGYQTSANNYSHSEGYQTSAYVYSHSEGFQTQAIGNITHAEGYKTVASDSYTHAEGFNTSAMTNTAHAEGLGTLALKTSSHAEGQHTIAGQVAHAEGENTIASGSSSHAEGIGAKTFGAGSHAEGDYTIASGNYSHAEGSSTSALTQSSHAEGFHSIASGYCSHSEGNNTIASGNSSHAEGFFSMATGDYSHAEGYYTEANNQSEHVSGQFNVTSSGSSTFGDSGNTLFSVGNGANDNARHNAFEIRQNGDIYIVNKNGQDVKLQDEIGNITIDQVIDSGTSASTNAVSTKAVYDYVADIEYTVATALNDLETNKLDASAYTPVNESSGITAMTGYAMAASGTPISTSDTLNAAIGKLEKMIDELKDYIEQKEMAIAAAITDLDNRLKAIE